MRPARAEIERLIEWTLPVADELGLTSFLTVPSISAAERQISATRRGKRSRRSTRRRSWSPYVSEQDAELEQEQLARELAEELRKLRVEDVL